MAISDLEAVMPPPNTTSAIEPTAWVEVEGSLGTSLPSDYKDFIGTYGLGRVAEFLCVLTPFSDNPNVNLSVQMERKLSALRELHAAGEKAPYPLFPATGGIMPFAVTDNGDVLHWETNGPPDAWHVVVNDARSPMYEVHNSGMTTFLAGLFSPDFDSAILPRGLTPEFRSFDV